MPPFPPEENDEEVDQEMPEEEEAEPVLNTSDENTEEEPEAGPEVNELPQELKDALKGLKDELYLEIRSFRDYKIPMWRRNEAFWNNIQRAMYLDSVKSHISLTELAKIPELGIQDAESFNRIINVFRAHGESFVAALSANLPSPVYTPDDADNPKDIAAAKGYKKLSQLIEIRNRAILKFIKILYHIYVHGVAYTYVVNHRDLAYGTIKHPKIDTKTILKDSKICPQCGMPADNESEMEDIQAPPGPMGLPPMGSNIPQASFTCPNCGYQGEPETEQTPEEVPYISSYDESPKGRTLIEVYGPLHVGVPQDVRCLKEAGYLYLENDLDKALIKSIYTNIEFGDSSSNSVDAGKGKYDRTPANQPLMSESSSYVVSRWWFRPWMFYRIDDKAIRAALLKQFPMGAYVVFVDDKYAESVNESLDECWTATESPISERIHAEPYGNVLIPLQEMTSDLVSLVMETIESEIPINFFDPKCVDPKLFANRPASPGDWVPASARSGQSLDSAIAASKPASMSRGIDYFLGYLEKMSQFVLGTVPSIFGGQASSGSKTLGEYKESRAQALQRLSIPWVCSSTMWVDTVYKACNYTASLIMQDQADEKYAVPLGANNFVNVWIRQSELEGKVGSVSVEHSEQIPMTWNQKRTMIMDMMSQKIEQLDAVLYHPENIGLMENVMGLTDFYIPGDDDRDKQLNEIYELIQGEPIPGPPGPDGQPQNAPSVQIDPDVDAHPVHIEVLKAFLVSEIGQDLKKNNPQAYDNCLAHLNAHNQMMQMQMQQDAANQPPEEGGQKKPPQKEGPPPQG